MACQIEIGNRFVVKTYVVYLEMDMVGKRVFSHNYTVSCLFFQLLVGVPGAQGFS